MGVLNMVFILLALFLIACSPYAQTEGPVSNKIEKGDEPAQITVEEPVKEEVKQEVVKETIKPIEIDETLKMVYIKEKGFDPQNFVIKKNVVVRFNNSDVQSGKIHNIIGWKIDEKTVRFQTGKLEYGKFFDVTLPVPGAYMFVDVGLEDENERELYQGKIQVTQ